MDRAYENQEFRHYPLRRVAMCAGWAIHGFVFEFANGHRTGTVMANDGTEMGLSDESIRSRGGNWAHIDPGDEIVRITGHNLNSPAYLCSTITLHLRSERSIQFSSSQEGWKGAPFCFKVPKEPGLLRSVRFGWDGVRGLDYVRTTLHLPIQRELVPTYPLRLRSFLRQLVAGRDAGLPPDVWYGGILCHMTGAEMLENFEDEEIE